MLATRDGFGKQLAESGADERIMVLGADLAKATKLDGFAKKYPDRYIECGIAEANMIGIASGLSEHGKRVFLASFASFLTGRYDIIRCSLAYPNAKVVLVGTHSGMAIGKDGVTQMGLEDVNVMRGLPNMEVLQPATAVEAAAMTKYLCETTNPKLTYLRLGRQPVQEVFNDSYVYNHGKAVVVREAHTGVTVLSSGCVLSEVLDGCNHTVINVPCIKPFDHSASASLWRSVDRGDVIVTVEDHSIIGGLGTVVAEALSVFRSGARLVRIGLNDIFPESGPPAALYEKYGLSAAKLKERLAAL